MLRGCSCKTGCKTRRCSCRKAERKCGPGCGCCNCENSPVLESEVDTGLEEEENAVGEALLRRTQAELLVETDEEEASHSDLSEDERDNEQ